MSTKLWIGNTLYVVDEEVAEYVSNLESNRQTCKKCKMKYLADSHEYPCPYCTPPDKFHALQQITTRLYNYIYVNTETTSELMLEAKKLLESIEGEK